MSNCERARVTEFALRNIRCMLARPGDVNSNKHDSEKPGFKCISKNASFGGYATEEVFRGPASCGTKRSSAEVKSLVFRSWPEKKLGCGKTRPTVDAFSPFKIARGL